AGDAVRGEQHYRRALRLLPEFVQAGVHLAELEIARGDRIAARARLESIVARQAEPEALALLGTLETAAAHRARGARRIERARRIYENLLLRHPSAYADHAAEFFLGPGRDPERAWTLALRNLDARTTDRALGLAERAARATGRAAEGERLAMRRRERLAG